MAALDVAPAAGRGGGRAWPAPARLDRAVLHRHRHVPTRRVAALAWRAAWFVNAVCIAVVTAAFGTAPWARDRRDRAVGTGLSSPRARRLGLLARDVAARLHTLDVRRAARGAAAGPPPLPLAPLLALLGLTMLGRRASRGAPLGGEHARAIGQRHFHGRHTTPVCTTATSTPLGHARCFNARMQRRGATPGCKPAGSAVERCARAPFGHAPLLAARFGNAPACGPPRTTPRRRARFGNAHRGPPARSAGPGRAPRVVSRAAVRPRTVRGPAW
jgi:hypothetical protein